MIYIFSILSLVLRAWELVIFVWVIMSWLPGAQQSALGRTLGNIVGILCNPIRRMLPRTGMIDFSPLLALLLLSVAQMGLRALSQVF